MMILDILDRHCKGVFANWYKLGLVFYWLHCLSVCDESNLLYERFNHFAEPIHEHLRSISMRMKIWLIGKVMKYG